MTSQIFGEGRYFKQQEDTTLDPNMQEYVEDDWDASPMIHKKKPGDKAATEKKGKTGNVVPFFPKDWRKNANDVFNHILNPEGTVDAVDVSHAAIYRKVPIDEH